MRVERIDRGGDALYLRLGGVVADEPSAKFDSRLVADNELGGAVLVSLRDVVLLNSSGIGMLLQLNRKLREKNGRLVLLDVPANVRHVLQFMKLEEVLCIADDERSAFEKLQ